MDMVFNRRIAVNQIFTEKPVGTTYKKWKEDAAIKIAREMVDHNLMTHHSEYDIAGGYTHEAFMALVATPKRILP